ncbi:hypothetical protein Droror1_Dr00013869 [Drosera rotundifolia]
MPRCRRGYIHVVNNDFTQWEMYAIGGSANPTINSQGNRYIAPSNPYAKEVFIPIPSVQQNYTIRASKLQQQTKKSSGTDLLQVTKRVDTEEGAWKDWNWRSEGDIMVNGAFFIASGEELEVKYEKAYSVEPKSVAYIDQLTMNSGVFGSRHHNSGKLVAVPGSDIDLEDDDDEDDNYGSNAPAHPSLFIYVFSYIAFVFSGVLSIA